jgi:hypothetical protein
MHGRNKLFMYLYMCIYVYIYTRVYITFFTLNVNSIHPHKGEYAQNVFTDIFSLSHTSDHIKQNDRLNGEQRIG